MAVLFENLRVLQAAEEVADELWKLVVKWDQFQRDTVGKQMVRAVDSVGANIAEAFGRFHYGEKLQFLYYARGSLYETKYWLNRGRSRNLFTEEVANEIAQKLSKIAHQLNTFVKTTKKQRNAPPKNSLRESIATYSVNLKDEFDNNLELFTKEEIDSLANLNSPNNPITQLPNYQLPTGQNL